LTETSGILSTAGATGIGPVVCPCISGLCRAGLLCLWLAESRTEKLLDKESGAVSVLENEQQTVVTVNAYADVTVQVCELELRPMLIMNVKTKTKTRIIYKTEIK